MKTSASELTGTLLSSLWEGYLRRVPYARKYQEMVAARGGRLVIDHLAFRTLNIATGEQPAGIEALSHLLLHLGYHVAGSYRFDHQKLTAIHFEHEDEQYPRFFVSQLEVAELPVWTRDLIHEAVVDTPYLLSDVAIELMNCLGLDGTVNEEAGEILAAELTGYFRRPWPMISREAMLRINDVSQYAAWVLLHGNAVNHFAAAIHAQNVAEWPGIAETCQALAHAGIPMKEEIEGEEGSVLRQTATLPVVENYLFPGASGDEEMEWTYAYFELTERGFTGSGSDRKLFPGFITGQASQLFKMTRTRVN